jgi:predicted GNAT superfamily acetyltransferase
MSRTELDPSVAARNAAQRAGVEVRVLDAVPDFEEASRLVSRIWRDDDPKAPASLLRALSHAGNFVAGAWRDGSLVGISLGFFGFEDDEFHLTRTSRASTPRCRVGRSASR